MVLPPSPAYCPLGYRDLLTMCLRSCPGALFWPLPSIPTAPAGTLCKPRDAMNSLLLFRDQVRCEDRREA